MRRVVLALILITGIGALGWSAVPVPELVIYYDYEDFQGGFVIDKSGHGHDGKINGNITQVPGKRGMAAKFESGSFLDLDGPNFPAEDIPEEEMSVCAWVKCQNTGGHHAIFNVRGGDGTWIIHPELRNNGQFRWLLRTKGGSTIFDIRAGTVEWDTWLHYAGVYSSIEGYAALYINGQEIIKQNVSKLKLMRDWTQGARVGYNIDNARPFTGLMDDLCIWSKALKPDEIKNLMENGPLPKAVSAQGKLATFWGNLKRL
jgi:hypothetical protein